MTRDTVRKRRRSQLEADIAGPRCICILEDAPGDYYNRVCRRCGAPVRAYILAPASRGSAGREVLRCTRGHFLHTKECRVRKSED